MTSLIEVCRKYESEKMSLLPSACGYSFRWGFLTDKDCEHGMIVGVGDDYIIWQNTLTEKKRKTNRLVYEKLVDEHGESRGMPIHINISAIHSIG